MPSNSNLRAHGIRTEEPGAESWLIFDGLPRELREVIWAAPVSISPISARAHMNDAGASEAARMLLGAIEREGLMFAEAHMRQHGYPLPHVAAGVARQGY